METCKAFAPSSKAQTCENCSRTCIFCKQMLNEKFPAFVCIRHSKQPTCVVCGEFADYDGFSCQICEDLCKECCHFVEK